MKTITRCLIPALGLISIVHFGCQTLSTNQENPPSGSEINGMLYYLPIGKITIKGEFEDTDAVQISVAPSRGKQKPAPGGDSGGAGQNSVTISAAPLTITLIPEVEADENVGPFYATPQANYLYEDEAKLAVNAKHLLSTGNVTTEDKTVEIVGSLASLAKQFAALTEEEKEEKPKPTPFWFSFHPSNFKEVQDVENALNQRGIYFQLSPASRPVAVDTKGSRFSSVAAQQLGKEGLLFRPAISYKIKLRYPNGAFSSSTTLINAEQQFVLPDIARLYEIKYNRMAFVKKVKEIGFSDGMLTEFHQKVPSPILGFLGIPKAVVQAIVPIPAAAPSGSGSASGTTGQPTN
jgi:hypothetical protein